MPSVAFSVDFDTDLEIIKTQFKGMKRIFTEAYFTRLLKRYYPDCEDAEENTVTEYFKNNKASIMARIKSATAGIQDRWEKVSDIFFRSVEKMTGFKFKNDIYKCIFSSSYIVGGGYERPNIIFVFPLKEDMEPVQIIAHEIFHLHFWDINDRLRLGLDNESLWDLSEVVVDLVLSDIEIPGFNYVHMIYPQHEGLYKKLKALWLKRKSFESFMRDAEAAMKS